MNVTRQGRSEYNKYMMELEEHFASNDFSEMMKESLLYTLFDT
jgi:hypothetical protein